MKSRDDELGFTDLKDDVDLEFRAHLKLTMKITCFY